ncbi:MAG: radical SAM protein [Sandaracinaceae bacterium]
MEVLTRLGEIGGRGTATTAMIEIADRCNEVCVHCYQVQGTKGELETADWRQILDELAELGVLVLTISGGEATLRDDFLELVAYARQLKFAVKLYTNALRLDDAMADELARLAVQEVQISLYSPRAEVHDAVTGVPGSFEKVVRAVRLLRARGVGTVIKTVLASFNVDDRDAYIKLASDLDTDFMFDPQISPREDGDRTPQAYGLSVEQRRAVQKDERLVRSNVVPASREERLDQAPCGACVGHVHVEANGELRPCTQLGWSYGDARDGIRRAWESRPVTQLRDMRWRDLIGCRDCELSPYCSRCYANALKESGDALAPYASACQRAQLRYEAVVGVRPSIDADDQSPPGVGPFRAIAQHRFVQFSATRPANEDRVRAALGWTLAPVQSAVPQTELVQIRRRGPKRTRPTVVQEQSTDAEPRSTVVDSRAPCGQTKACLE